MKVLPTIICSSWSLHLLGGVPWRLPGEWGRLGTCEGSPPSLCCQNQTTDTNQPCKTTYKQLTPVINSLTLATLQGEKKFRNQTKLKFTCPAKEFTCPDKFLPSIFTILPNTCIKNMKVQSFCFICHDVEILLRIQGFI